MKLEFERKNCLGVLNVWLTSKYWKLCFPSNKRLFFHFQKLDKNGKNGERMCYNVGIMKKCWGWKWSLSNITFFTKFPADNYSPYAF